MKKNKEPKRVDTYDTLRQVYEFNLVKDQGIYIPTKEHETARPLTQACSPYLEFSRFLCVGGEAFLFLVYDTRLGKSGKRVLKIPRPTRNAINIERFKRSARALVTLNSPFFPYVVELSEEPLYLLLEWIPGETLRSWVESRRYDLNEAIEYMRKLLKAVSLLHKKGVLHRDLKPDNIIVSGDEIRVIDFGLAKLKSDRTLTRTGSAIGVEGYISPEQDISPETVDSPSSDVYSLGAILYYLLTKKDVEFNTEVLYSLGYSPAVVNLYQIACRYAATGRFKDAEEMLEAVNDVFPPPQTSTTIEYDMYQCLKELLVLCAGDLFKVQLLTGLPREELINYLMAIKGRTAKKCLYSLDQSKTQEQKE